MKHDDEYYDMCRQILGEYLKEGVPMRVLAARHGMSISAIHNRMQDARYLIRRDEHRARTK